jgi:hypothetical protein
LAEYQEKAARQEMKQTDDVDILELLCIIKGEGYEDIK